MSGMPFLVGLATWSISAIVLAHHVFAVVGNSPPLLTGAVVIIGVLTTAIIPAAIAAAAVFGFGEALMP